MKIKGLVIFLIFIFSASLVSADSEITATPNQTQTNLLKGLAISINETFKEIKLYKKELEKLTEISGKGLWGTDYALRSKLDIKYYGTVLTIKKDLDLIKISFGLRAGYGSWADELSLNAEVENVKKLNYKIGVKFDFPFRD